MYLERTQLDCCGLLEIYDFPYDLDPYSDHFEDLIIYDDVRNKDILPTKKKMKEAAEAALLEAMSERNDKPYSHMIVTLIDIQKKLWNAMLKRNGFKLVSSTINGNTNNMVYMYVRTRPVKKYTASKPKNGTWTY